MGNSYLLFKGKVSDTHLMIVKNELDRAEAAGNMPDLKPLTSKLKSPILGLIISILFGFIGFDRFYKGDAWLGIFKILLCIIPVFLLMSAAQNGDNDLAGFASLIMCVGIVWCIADLFLVYTGIKKDNFKKIMASL